MVICLACRFTSVVDGGIIVLLHAASTVEYVFASTVCPRFDCHDLAWFSELQDQTDHATASRLVSRSDAYICSS